MDYHNADGSIGEMCGNGARVFAALLREEGLVTTDEFAIATRGGLRPVRLQDDCVSVDMGIPRTDESAVKVTANGLTWEAQAVFMPNPHAVAFVDDLQEPGPLNSAPEIDSSVFPDGTNVEFVVVQQPGEHVSMRVHERGGGDTSCGTGICAVADRSLQPVRRSWPGIHPGGRSRRHGTGATHHRRNPGAHRAGRTGRARPSITPTIGDVPWLIPTCESRISSPTARRCAGSPGCPPNSRTSARSNTARSASNAWSWWACGPTAAP